MQKCQPYACHAYDTRNKKKRIPKEVEIWKRLWNLGRTTLKSRTYRLYYLSCTVLRATTANLSQARSNNLPQIVLTSCFLYECIETQNIGKDQSLAAVVVLRNVKNFILLYLQQNLYCEAGTQK